MVTADDYRFLVAEDAINRIENRIKLWGLPYPLNKAVALEQIKKLKSTFMKIKYSYLPYTMLIEFEEFKNLEQFARELASILLPPKTLKLDTTTTKLAVAEIRYALSVLLGLRNRIALGDDNNPEYAIDVVGVEVGYVEKHPKAEKLWVTKAGTEQFSLTIVTNIQGIKKGELRGAAILPPIAFFDIVSEAMYCTNPLEKSFKGKRIPSNFVHKVEIINVVESIVENVR
ncbi:MAG: tRNA-binding protein [Ignisphaera sp.]